MLGDGPISQDIEEEAVGRKGCKLVWVSVFSLLLFGFFFFFFLVCFPLIRILKSILKCFSSPLMFSMKGAEQCK